MQNILTRFPINLSLPDAESKIVDDAAEAIKQEYRNSVRWKRLRCRKVTPLTDDPDETIFIIEVGHSVQFDWTWEGAVAFRPPNIKTFEGGDIDVTDDFAGLPSDGPVWSGEVVEVDETKGHLFVSVSNPEYPPRTGSFYVRPFRFLEFLHKLYSKPDELLAERLNACRGNVHPLVNNPASFGLEELRELWGHSWAILWGPPGTGKTFTTGKQVAACLKDSTERILVVSTTNRATDEAALSIGRASRFTSRQAVDKGRILRIGKSAGYSGFHYYGLEGMLRGTETEILCKIGKLSKDLQGIADTSERAKYQELIRELRQLMKDNAFNIFVSPEVQVIICTAFKAVQLLDDANIRSLIAGGEAPFTTIIIDESGLISRAATAALSLLASRRVLLVGDAKQLAPISKISRVLPTSQATWIASSSLRHLQQIQQVNPAVHLLREQHRMHPDIRQAVSEYQYGGELRDADNVKDRSFALPLILQEQPRAIWYVLDEDKDLSLPSIRAERGPGNRSWIRKSTYKVLEKFFLDPDVCQKRGLFLSPFKAQAKEISQFLAEKNLQSWSAATIHSQQGAEADLVIFDTVNAGSTGWSYEEWKRLVNVGISRAREFVMLLASRAEMNEPYLKPLLPNLAPRTFNKSGDSYVFVEVPKQQVIETKMEQVGNPNLLGNQLAQRKALRPVMSAEQQRLIGRTLDEGPRLVRGVAGSGKTVVLSHWLVQTVRKLSGKTESPIWAVYANKALEGLIRETIEDAWNSDSNSGAFPWENVSLLHIKDILAPKLQEIGLDWNAIKDKDPLKYDWNKLSKLYLEGKPVELIKPCCNAVFVDEAQDLGPNTLRLLTALVEQSNPDDPNSRAVNIFYDNAQNIFGRPTPTWSEIGLDMKGRSTIMKESFRSTKPITELALNVLYRLQPPEKDEDHKEMVRLGLVEKSYRDGDEWWNVRFNQVDGPVPLYEEYASLEQQIDALGGQLVRWIRDEHVKPGDICVLYNGQNIEWRLQNQVAPKLKAIGADLSVQKSKAFKKDDSIVIATTSQSFKGYDSEVVVVAAAEQFVAKDEEGAGKKKILANNLYVAMTRARSILAVYSQNKKDGAAGKLVKAIDECLNPLLERPAIEKEISNRDDFEEVAALIGSEHEEWLEKLWKAHTVEQEPILAPNGKVLAEPIFWFRDDNQTFACFGNETPSTRIRHNLEDAGITIIKPGEDWKQVE